MRAAIGYTVKEKTKVEIASGRTVLNITSLILNEENVIQIITVEKKL